MTSSQCAWCPWDCPSPEAAACRQPEAPQVLTGVCEPAWTNVRTVRKRKTVDIIRDLSDWPQPTAEAVDSP